MASKRSNIEKAIRTAVEVSRGTGRSRGINWSNVSRITGIPAKTAKKLHGELERYGSIVSSDKLIDKLSEIAPSTSEQIHAVNQALVRVFREGGNSIKNLSISLGISEREAREVMAGKLEPGQVDRYLEKVRASSSVTPFEGMDAMRRTAERKGRDWKISSFEYEPGKGLPARGDKYQVIMKGKIDGKERYITGLAGRSPEDALENATVMVRNYHGFEAVEVEILVYKAI